MGDIFTASGTRIYIAGAVTETQADSVAEFAALTGWTEVGLVETYGEFGDESAAVTFAAVGDARIRKAKGARDAGTLALTVGYDPLDAGQISLETAEGTNDNYAFKVVLPDAPSADYNDTTIYFRGLVMSKRKNIGTNDNVVRRMFNIGINSQLFEVVADRQTIS